MKRRPGKKLALRPGARPKPKLKPGARPKLKPGEMPKLHPSVKQRPGGIEPGALCEDRDDDDPQSGQNE